MSTKSTRSFEERWTALSRELSRKMAQWRNEHPKATLRQIEAAMDEQLAAMRARMIEDLVSTSAAGDWSSAPEAHPPRCPQCGQPLEKHGKHPRRLKTEGGAELEFQREYGVCPHCGAGLFPPR
jgi:hypothetical protein